MSKWIELIRVRSSESSLRTALPIVSAHVREIEAETFVLQHALYDGDLAVVVVWRNGNEPRKSREGLLLAENLQQWGSIDHAVWIPTDAKE